MRHYHNGLRKHLRKTEEIIGRPLTFALINAQSSRFNEEWTNYLSFIAINSQGDSGLMPNSIGKENKNIKAFFNWCFDKNITTRFSLKGYPTIMEDVDKNHITNFNKMIREICESLNMKDEIKFYREIAGKTIKVTKYKFEEVSSHTCRRTFCTLKFLKGMPASL